MSRTVGRIVRATVACLCLLGAASALAAGADHLRCFKIHDPAPRAGYTVGFETHDNAFPGFSIENGCVVKTPARLMCVDVIKLRVTPPPPGAPDGKVVGQSYLCYKMKCGRNPVAIPVDDQFGGARTVQEVGGARLVCAPNATFSPSGAFLDQSAGSL